MKKINFVTFQLLLGIVLSFVIYGYKLYLINFTEALPTAVPWMVVFLPTIWALTFWVTIKAHGK